MSRRLVVLLMLTLMLLGGAPGRWNADAQETGVDTSDVLPDDFYVHQRCEQLINRASNYDQLIPARDIVTKACSDYAVSGDGVRWISATKDAAKKIVEFDPTSGRFDAKIIQSNQLIPTGYDTYVLFLVPSENWKAELEDYRQLFDSFKAFGGAIGSRRLAIWFGYPAPQYGIDVDHSKDFCDKLHFEKLSLSYEAGPYVVITSKYPERPQRLTDFTVLRLDAISPRRVIALLNFLEQQLRTQQTVNKRALYYSEVKEQLLTAYDRHSNLLVAGAMYVVTGRFDRFFVQNATAPQQIKNP